MNVGVIKVLGLLVASCLYWQIAAQTTGVHEPWDAPGYWYFWYPASLAMSAGAGLLFRVNGWWPGLVITFSQLPVMWLNTGIGPLVVFGIVFLGALAIPAMALSYLTGWIADRRRPR